MKSLNCKYLKLFFKIFLYLLISGIIFLFGYILFCKIFLKQEIPMIFGYGTAVVTTNSMEPTLNINDLIFIHTQNDYKVDDIIAFVDNDKNLVVHRIVEIKDNLYYTKGDNIQSKIDKEPKTIQQIKGKVVGVCANVGEVAMFLQTPLGVLVLFAGIGLLYLFISMVISGFRRENNLQDEE